MLGDERYGAPPSLANGVQNESMHSQRWQTSSGRQSALLVHLPLPGFGDPHMHQWVGSPLSDMHHSVEHVISPAHCSLVSHADTGPHGGIASASAPASTSEVLGGKTTGSVREHAETRGNKKMRSSRIRFSVANHQSKSMSTGGELAFFRMYKPVEKSTLRRNCPTVPVS